MRMKRRWKGLLLTACIGVALLLAVGGVFFDATKAPSPPAFRFLGENEPNRCSKMDVGDGKVIEYIYSFPAKFETWSEAARAELTALGFTQNPDSATPDQVFEFTRFEGKTHITVCLQKAKLLSDGSDQDHIVYGDEPGWVCVEILQHRQTFTWRQELRYLRERLTP
jgi:hypothetical protein